MTRSRFLAAAATLALLPASALPAAAATTAAPAARIIERLDADRDGAVHRAEFLDHAAKRFAAADGDGDGVLTAAEFAAAAKPRHERRANRILARLDRDGDARASLAETARAGRIGRRFERADADRDGLLTAAEIAAAAERHGARRIERLVRRADADGDGRVSKSEATKVAEARFERLDQNGDGLLQAAELAASMRRLAPAGPKGGRTP